MLLATVLSLTQMMAQTVPITIGTGTSSNTSGPIPGLYGNHRSIQLFTAAELGQEGACVVDSIALELGSVTAGIGGRAVRIYMKEVIDTTVAASQVIGTLTDGAVLVYSSTDEVCTSNTWHTFVLQTPFAYSGSNSLMIIFEGEGCTTSGRCSVNIKYTDNNKAWTKCWDETAPDFTTPVAKTNSYRANTRFYVSTTIPADYCPPASNFVFSNLTTDGAEISWTSTATSFEYEYKLASEDWTSENVVSGTTTSPSVSLSGLTSGTSYNFRVKAICTSGTEAFWIGGLSLLLVMFILFLINKVLSKDSTLLLVQDLLLLLYAGRTLMEMLRHLTTGRLRQSIIQEGNPHTITVRHLQPLLKATG